MTDRHPQVGREAQAAEREEEQGGPDPEELTDVTHSPQDEGAREVGKRVTGMCDSLVRRDQKTDRHSSGGRGELE